MINASQVRELSHDGRRHAIILAGISHIQQYPAHGEVFTSQSVLSDKEQSLGPSFNDSTLLSQFNVQRELLRQVSSKPAVPPQLRL